MIGLSSAEATVLAALLPVLVVQLVALHQNRQVKQATKAAAEQYRPNGGSSLRDAVDRLEQMVRRLHERHDTLNERIYMIEDHVTRPKER